MSRQILATLALAGLLSAGAMPAGAQPAGGVPRVGVSAAPHQGFVRLTLNLPSVTPYAFRQDAQRAEIQFFSPIELDRSAFGRMPGHLLGVDVTPESLVLRLAPGVELRHRTMNGRLVLDLLDSAQPAAARTGNRAAARPAAGPAQAARNGQPQPVGRSAPREAKAPERGRPAAAAPAAAETRPPQQGATPVAATGPASSPSPAHSAGRDGETAAPQPAPPSQAATLPVPLNPAATLPQPVAAEATPPSRPATPASLRLPFAPRTGAAALVRGGALLIVFDEHREIDQAALARMVPGAELVPHQGATILRLPLQAAPSLRRERDAWVLAQGAAEAPKPIAAEHLSDGTPRLLLPAEGASRAIVVPDPETGGLMLVGTMTGTAAVLEGRRYVAFDLLPTRLGVALALRSDELALRPAGPGFVVPLASSGALTLAPPPRAGEVAAARVERVVDLPDRAVDALLDRRRALLAELAATPALGRGAKRVDLAEVLLALGFAAEAQAMLQMAAGDDPRLGALPRTRLLLGMAATLAGRPTEAAEALTPPGLPDAGEVALWRGLVQEPGAPASPAFAAAAPLVLGYPAAMRASLLPMAALALGEGGAASAAARLLELAGAEARQAPMTRFALARIAEVRGDTARASEEYKGLTRSSNWDARARALGRLAELQLASGELDAAGAADALQAAIPAWRGDERELSRRLRAVDLRMEAGQPNEALALMAETETLFPDQTERMRDKLGAAMVSALGHPAVRPAEAARFFNERRERIPPGPELDAALARVADGLIALDLNGEAAALLRRGTPRGQDPAGLAVRLGEALLAEGDAGGALTALRTGEGSAALPGDLGRRRSLAEARARSETGDVQGATAVLRSLGQEGQAPLSEILAVQRDWTGAAAALSRHAEAALPSPPAALDADAQQLVLRLAAFLTLARDEAGLAQLRARYGAQMQAGPLAGAFATVTSPGSSTDLRRLRAEIAQARALPQQLKALR